jgi:hypothetical protein
VTEPASLSNAEGLSNPTLVNVPENPYRVQLPGGRPGKPTGKYYALVEKGGKQFRRARRTPNCAKSIVTRESVAGGGQRIRCARSGVTVVGIAGVNPGLRAARTADARGGAGEAEDGKAVWLKLAQQSVRRY